MQKTLKRTITVIILLCVAFAFACFAACENLQHTHIYKVTIDEKYLKSAATCTTKAVYYKSCSCGEVSETETFETGTLGIHTYSNRVCTVCGKKQPSEGLEFALNEKGTEYSVTGIGTCTDTDLVIPETYNDLPVTSIGRYAFSSCNSLITITISKRILKIESGAFKGCELLTNIEIPNTVMSMDCYDAFSNCSSLQYNEYDNALYLGNDTNNYLVLVKAKSTDITSCVINENCKFIYSNAFYNCRKLTSMTIPNFVVEIGGSAFEYCTSLTSITVGVSMSNIGSNVFYACPKLVEVINKSSLTITKESIDNGHIGCYALNIKTEGESDIENKDGYLFYTYDNVNYLLGYAGNATSLTLPDNYKGQNYEIYKCAFYYCRSLTRVNISDGVTGIGKSAFWGCSSLVSVTVGDNVTSIESSAFQTCNKLVEVINKSNQHNGYLESYALNVKTEGKSDIENKNGYLFYTYGNVNYLLGYVGNETSLTLPENYKGQNYKIYKNAFSYCGLLTSVAIPNSVTSIGDYAFWLCDSLTNVYYKGTAEQWANISIDSTNSYLTNATRYYYSESEPTKSGNYWHYDENGNIIAW